MLECRLEHIDLLCKFGDIAPHELIFPVLGWVVIFRRTDISVGNRCASFQEPKDVTGTKS